MSIKRQRTSLAPGSSAPKAPCTQAALADRAEPLRRLALSVEHERRRIARRLHDHLQQLLAVAKLRADPLEARLTDPADRRCLQDVRDLLAECIETSHAIVLDLYPPILHEAGLVAALECLVGRMQDEHGLAVQLIADPDAEPPGEDLRSFLYQAVRELLRNVVHHANARRAIVRLERTGEGGVCIVVQDDGAGAARESAEAPWQAQGRGLPQIRERLEYLGGTMDIAVAQGGGTCVRLTIGPWSEPIEAPELPAAVERQAGVRVRPVAQVRPGQSIRILLVDDHAVMRQGLAALLTDQPDMEVVGEASDGPGTIDLVEQTCPGVIIMDVSMPGMSGVEAARRIHAAHPGIRIIGLSMYEQDDMARKMLRAGAVAYLSKGCPADQLLKEVRKVAPAACPVDLEGK